MMGTGRARAGVDGTIISKQKATKAKRSDCIRLGSSTRVVNAGGDIEQARLKAGLAGSHAVSFVLRMG